MSGEHIPVLVDEVIQFLQPKNHGVYMDGTVGLGGHAAVILQKSAPHGSLLGIDLDSDALAIARERLSEYKERVTLVDGNFAHLDQLSQLYPEPEQTEAAIAPIDGILFDLGVSSLQLDTPERGFSFNHSGPLDMRMDANQPLSASHVVNRHSGRYTRNDFYAIRSRTLGEKNCTPDCTRSKTQVHIDNLSTRGNRSGCDSAQINGVAYSSCDTDFSGVTNLH